MTHDQRSKARARYQIDHIRIRIHGMDMCVSACARSCLCSCHSYDAIHMFIIYGLTFIQCAIVCAVSRAYIALVVSDTRI